MGEGLPGETGGGPGGPAAGSRIAGYVLEEEIGAGGMAVVFRARDERLDRLVALKLLTPGLAGDAEFRRRFLRESRAAAAVDDPHIIPVYEAGEAGGVLFIAMRYVSGGDVRGLLRREGPLPPGRAAAILSPVASALDAAHGAGLVHRDVKPGNMLIDARPGRPDHVYLSDFGLAKGGSASALTGTGLYLGTVAYMAPEQIQGQGVDGRADQYALGCAAFELLGGEVPFERDQDMAVIYAHLSVPPPSLASKRPGLPPAVDGALARALAKAPEDRYPSCREFAEALRQGLGLPGYDRGPGVAVARAAASGQAPGTPTAESGATEVRPVTGGDRGVPGSGRSGPGEGGGTRELPQGTVTFLFTDLEGSTRRWEEHPAQMRDALARHNTIVRGAVESHGGVVFSTMGDGLAAVFASAREAVRGVLAAQQGLGAVDWGEVTGPLAARMGLLTDEGVLGGEHYLNQPLNRCARLMAAGHGGQALVSGATELLVRDDLPDGCALVDLGEHRLRDLARPVRIFQLAGPGLRAEFPPLRTLEAFAGNLPVQLSSFVGRAGELGQVAAAMQRSPLVTVTGPGGVGKTRLALQAAADQLPSFSDGAWLCELAPAQDGEAMAQAVATALRARPRPGLSTAGSVVEFLRTRSALLLVLDNCEHLADAAAALAADILRTCSGVRVLATSQQALGVGGEQVFALRPLSLPAPDAGMAAASGSDAVSLFAQRAAAVRGDFALSPANVAAVGEICRRLDGIPLAIELAAARVAALGPAEIAGLLDERFRLLTRGRSDAARRQQTLQATVEWSYGLLGEADRRVFGCLGVFPGSFDAEAAVAVADAGGLARWDVLDGLTELVGKSLVVQEEGPDQTSRYRLLETMRAYTGQQLAAVGEPDRLRHRHAEHYAAFAERAGLEVTGPAQLEWQPRIRAERDNLQAAVTWALSSGDQARPLAFRIVAALVAFAITSPGTVAGWAEACLAQISECPPELRGMVIAAAGWSAFWAGDLLLAQRRAEDALRAAAADDPIGTGLLRVLLAQTCTFTGEPERGASLARQARQEAAELGIEALVGNMLATEAMAWTAAGDYAAARPPAMEAVEVARRVQNPALSAYAFLTAAGAIWPGEPQTALMLIEDCLALTRAGASDPILGTAPMLAGVIRARNGDLPGALAALQEAMAQQHADGNRLLLGGTLQLAAVVLALLGEAEPAAVLSGAFSAHFPPDVSVVNEDQKMGIGEARSLARQALGGAAYSAALARGAEMDDDEVVGYAQGQFRRLVACAEPAAQAPESPPGQTRPSRRE